MTTPINLQCVQIIKAKPFAFKLSAEVLEDFLSLRGMFPEGTPSVFAQQPTADKQESEGELRQLKSTLWLFVR